MDSSTPTSSGTGGAAGRGTGAEGRVCLLVDVPADLASSLSDSAERCGLQASAAPDHTAVRDALYDLPVAVCVVYFGRNAAQGTATTRTIRKHPHGERPAIIGIAHTSILAQLALGQGLDDVLAVPFTVEEAAFRLRLALWRAEEDEAEGAIRIGPVTLDPSGMRVRVHGAPVDLTYKEFALLRYLASNPGVALSRDRILAAVWGDEYFGGDRTVDIHVRRLRAKLPPIEDAIQTVHGVGYRFTPPAEPE